jgi:hypothetical protein
MIQVGSGNCAIVVWHLAHKPSEAQRTAQSAQKLRVWWCMPTRDWSGGFIPKDKSIAEHSLIAQVYQSGESLQGQETIDWGSCRFTYDVDAIAIVLGEKTCALSLLCPLSNEV